MYKIYSNLRTCLENLDGDGGMDAHIALYVLTHHEDAAGMSIEEMAEACATSPASISRFCRRVNGSGFREFIDQLEEYNAWLRSESATSRQHEIVDIPWYFDTLEAALYETRTLLDEDLVAKAVDWIAGARNVYFYGSSFSNLIAREACEKLNRINRFSFAFSSVRGQLDSLDLIGTEDVAVLISFSGQTKHVLDLYREAWSRGCRVIWISSNRSLARQSSERELLLPVSPIAFREYRTSLIESISLRIAIDVLFISYTNRLRSSQ